jgi:putative heme-binding domain-containing protein
LFRTQCAACHGPDGGGSAQGRSLIAGAFRRGDTDEQLFQTVLKGIPGTNMPPFPGSGREAWQIVAHLRSLAAGKAAEHAKGNPARGEQVFQQSGCRQCHAVDGDGGITGPDLATIGAVRSLSQIQRAITEPNREVPPEYWTLRAKTRGGKEISGIRLNEDTFSFQYSDANGLRAVLKKDLAEHRIVTESPMPSFANKLSARDLEDLVTYLAGLRGGNRP